ncbi:superfamily I DNA/RNA helicase/RecB family exonuclease [Nocardioides thalensis]|uniref:DNA 3'-5' helicase n=1 Tax=Nocardioides thalensis TaxID=1914755 RepID=A0A853C5I0_9ACTN|nr:ATP-dependent DNA helicase [Nocardioides thalensis]NYJ02276.1 superfamily I DNA/RNA helicase/RecB family exonuclease [Nocardioides thalensis]
MTATQQISYHLAPPAAATAPPTLDEHQQRVVDHPGGPLLVLAGPGTGKTTTLVEAIVDRIERRDASPDQVLALTFSRKAADQLRDRVTARLGRTTGTQLSSTFHSFAYGLVRRYAPAELYEAPLRLLSAPEQDVVLRELLADHPESVRWPDRFRHALGTRGFAREVHAVLGRAREKGLDGEALRRLGEESGTDEYVAAGLFLEQYLDSLDSQGATDYADLIRRARIEAEVHRDELRAQYDHVFVDEYQDTNPGQVALLRAIAGDGRNLVVVGDPHQSIYAFRGAEVRGILRFPTDFPQADGRPGDVVALRTTRRFGNRILLASQRVAGRIGLPGTIDEGAREAFLSPESLPGPHGDGRVEVITFDTERAEADHLADILRRAHLEDGIGWDDMAVLVRSGRGSIPPLRRALGAAGVPVEVASDEVPLVRDPAVLPLLDALRAVVHLHTDDHSDPGYVDAGRAEALLTGPLGGMDAGDVRRLARQLRAREKDEAQESHGTPRSSRELVRLAVVDATHLDGLSGPEVERARAVAGLLARVRAELDAGAAAEELLWMLWSGTGWPQRLRRGVEAGGGAARRAHRDLDSVCALFDVAARAGERREHLAVAPFLESLVQQEIPADTLADRGVRGAAVRLLTAHRSKGLEWRLVVVAHVQDGGWPDLRRRTTLLQADRIGPGTVVPAVTPRELLAEERRLFYVACTRARERLVVTAVASPDDDGEQPSRFLEELVPDRDHIRHQVGRPPRPLSMTGLVAELRRTVADPDQPEALREAAARRLARLADETTGRRQLVPAADPATWWGTRAASWAERPLREAGRPVPISASVLDAIAACPARWFLESEAGGVVRAHQSANLGQLVHALAERVADGSAPAEIDALMAEVDQVWDRLDFRTPWSKAREHKRVRAALERFLTWHERNPRRLLDTEARFSTVVTMDDGTEVGLIGYADRIELDGDGRVVVVDLKTGRNKPSGPQVKGHVQLALYQYAVDEGALDRPEEGLTGLTSGGAELIQLGLEDGSDTVTTQKQEPHLPDGPERTALRERISHTARLLRDERFPAVAGEHCRDCGFSPLCPIKSPGSVVER